MSWELIGSIIGLLLFLGTIISYSVKVSKAFGELSASNQSLDKAIRGLNKAIDDLQIKNSEQHSEFYRRLGDHAERIRILEVKGERE